MIECINIAMESKGNTKINPSVGAAIVKDGAILALDCHRAFGAEHAEINVMNQAGSLCRGADLYVTLEPCASTGKTPPCVSRIVENGIKRVFIGVIDPNPENCGKGVRFLKAHNVEVFIGFAKSECAKLIEDFTKYIVKKIPYYTLKIAQSIDGKIATKTGNSKWITSKTSRDYVSFLRSINDAILVGINTVLIDNPQLTIRLKNFNKTAPFKIVLDTTLKIDENCKLFEDHPDRVVICTTENANSVKKKKLIDKGIKLYTCKKDNAGRIDLYDLSRLLIDLKIVRVLVEGGSNIFGSFIDCNLADLIYIFNAPIIIGGRQALSSIGGEGANEVACAKKIKVTSINKFEDDILIEAVINDYRDYLFDLTDRVARECLQG
jgi:diaminohydroxyphosphoribosylaminopyrimidine deaminase/5-amino-6-(5-phosphoribosylamino)uracil reductase